jgi:apolipoprotein N-acyltransferase
MKLRDYHIRQGVSIAFLMRMLAAPLTAALLWLAFPGGGGLWPLLFVALVPLLWVIGGFGTGTIPQMGLFGLMTGLFHFLALLYWLVIVLGHYGGLPPYLSVPGLVLLSLYMGLYFGIFALLARLFFIKMANPLVLWLIPCLWVALDWCRSFLFSGFPWMDLGYALAGVPWLLQSADLWGHYGLTFIIVLLNTLVALVCLAGRRRRGQFVLIAPVVVFCGVVAFYSFLRWRQIGNQMQSNASVRIAVVQGNIAQDQKWSPELQAKTLENYIDQSWGRVARNQPMLVVWPETALPFYPVTDSQHPLMQSVLDFVRQGQVFLLTGSPWVEPEIQRYSNSAVLFDAGGQIGGRYSKSHLVPFGEYVPLKKWLPFLSPLVENVGDFSPGTVSQPLVCQNSRIGVLICFESIFPEIARKWVGVKANLLVNLTNDAWYGRSSAPYHSLAMTVLRAVETRRSLVRAANTGFSGFIDARGQALTVSPLFEPWAGAAELALMEEKTWFAGWGYLFAPCCLGMVIFILTVVVLRNPSSKKKWQH